MPDEITPPPPHTPPPDWYPDPERPDALRYWDGELWTEHRHVQQEITTSGLAKIGPWFSQWSSALLDRWLSIAGIYALTAVPAMVASVAGFYVFARSVRVDLRVDENGSHLDTLQWPSVPAWITAVLLLMVGIVLGVLSRATLNHHLFAYHRGEPSTVGQSFTAILDRIGRVVGHYLLFAGAILALMLGAVALFAGAILIAPLLLILVVPLIIAGAIYLIPYPSMVEVGIAVAPKGVSPFAAAQRAISGRWGAIAGRVVLAGILASVASSIVQSPFSLAAGPLSAWMIDSSAISVEDAGTGALVLNDGAPAMSLTLSDLTNGSALFAGIAVAIVLYAVSGLVQQAINGSAITHIYREATAGSQ